MTNWARPRPWLPAIALFALVAFVRMILVSQYAESVPMWDEWDAEGGILIKPWLEHRLTLWHLFKAHNEHRVLFTRLLALTVFWLNGQQWDNLVGAFANVFVYASVATLAFVLFARGSDSMISRGALFVATVALAALPFSYENTLVGFQSQFYLMSGFAIALLSLAAMGPDSARTYGLVLFVAISGLFTMASGLLAPACAALILAARLVLRQLEARRAATVAALLLLITVLGYRLVPVIPGHQALKAGELGTWIDALIVATAWPLSTGLLAVLLLWSPTVLYALDAFRRRSISSHGLFALGLATWVLMQCAAMAYSRGSGMTAPASRYTDILALGLLTNLWFALVLCSAASDAHRFVSREVGAACAATFVLAAVLGLVRRTPEDLGAARGRSYLSVEHTERVRAFVVDDDMVHLQAPLLHIPYPDGRKLAAFLRDRTLRSILPASVREPLAVATSESHGAFVREAAHSSVLTHSCSKQPCRLGKGTWRSAELRTRFPYLEVPVFAGGKARGLKVGVASSEEELVEVRAKGHATPILPAPKEPFRLLASDNDDRSWIAVGAPAEASLLSVVARRVKVWMRRKFRDPKRKNGVVLADGVELPVVPQDNIPHALNAGEGVTVRFNAPRTGLVENLGVLIGTFGDTADGSLVVEACVEQSCQKGERSLLESRDNDTLAIGLAEPLLVLAQQQVELRISSVHATKPVAVWLYPAKPGAVCVVDAAQSCTDRAPRLVLDYLD